MNCRIVLLSLISAFLLLAFVVEASAQTRTVGVSVGNTFTYSAIAGWSSNDPNATPPSGLVELNKTQWLEVAVTAISGTNITGQLTSHYKNGTEITSGGWVDVDTGGSVNLTTWFISANLVRGDLMYTLSPYNTTTINETVTRTYANGVRDTNHVNLTSVSTSSLGNLSLATNLYWDKSTGVVVEFSTGESNQTGTHTTTWSEGLQISDSNVWTVPEFPIWTTPLIMLSAVAVIIARKRQPRRPLR
ncbi:MAG: hypothetical protein WCD81_09955 [Candidatus Bathyarchaeia archaeon]